MKIIILDRDGVINYDSREYIKSPDEWHAIPGSLDAIAKLNKVGYKVIVATNQSGIARKLYDLKTLHQIHEKMLRELKQHHGHIEEIFFCPHHPVDNCICRKPKPGMLHQIQQKYGVRFQDTFFIGDTPSDIEAATAVGCKPLLVLTGDKQKLLDHAVDLMTVPHFENLAAAVEYVTKPSSRGRVSGRGDP